MATTVNDLIRGYREDPPKFFNDILGFNAWEKQCKIARSVAKNKKTAVRSCHDSGKTAIAARIALWFLYTHTPAVVITTAPTYRQVSELLWREMRHAFRSSKVNLGGYIYETPQLNLADNWYAIGLSTDDPNRFQGFHSENLLLIVDEAPGVDQVIFDAAEGILTSVGAKTLLIGNPTELSGEFYSAFHKSRTTYSTLSISAFDTPNFTQHGITIEDIRTGEWKKKAPKVYASPYLVTPEWVAEKWKEWGEESPLWQVKVMGQFPATVLNTLITVAQIDSNLEYAITHQQTEQDKKEQHRFGVDVARFGDDSTVIVHGQGKHMMSIKAYSQMDTMETTGLVVDTISSYPGCRVTIDTDGLGAGVYDRLNELKFEGKINAELYAFRGAAKPSIKHKNKYANARAEAWHDFSQRVKSCDIILQNEDHLISDLTAVRYRMHSKGTILLEKKDEVKKRIGRSPDYGDAAVMCFFNVPVAGWVEWYGELAESYMPKDDEDEKEDGTL